MIGFSKTKREYAYQLGIDTYTDKEKVVSTARLVSQEPEQPVVFKQEELEQLVAPIALHPDSLVSQS